MNKSTLLLLIMACFLFSCKKKDVKEKTTHEECHHDYDTTRIVRSNDERLSNHFSQNEISPKIVINNIEENQTDIFLLGHRIKWMNSPKETILNIDNNQISLKNEMTLNEVSGLAKDSVDFANNWKQIKLYKFAGRDIIAIEMKYTPCVGIGCSVNFCLLYDPKNKTTNYFGSFRSDLGMNLYNFGDGKISFVSQSHLTNPDCDEKIYNLYAMDDTGIFQLQKKNGKPYEIHQYYTDEGIKEFENLYQDDWIKKIK